MTQRDAFSTMSPEELRDSREAQRLYEMIAGQWVSSTVRAAAVLGVMDALADGPRTLEEVAQATSADAAGIERLLRACRSLGLVSLSAETVQATPMGMLLGSDTPGSLRWLAILQGTPAIWALWGSLPEAVKAGRSQAVEILGHPYFAHLADDPNEADIFNHAMRDLTALVEADAREIVELGDARRIVDLGGGSGTFLRALLEANPDATGTVLDRPHALDAARSLAELPGLRGRLEVAEGDFFDAVPEADLFILKLILHDWSDAECVAILETIRRHASARSRVLVVEALVHDADGDGSAPDLAALMDMTLLVMMTGRERTLGDYDELFAAGGWVRRELRPSRSIYSFIELRPAPTSP